MRRDGQPSTLASLGHSSEVARPSAELSAAREHENALETVASAQASTIAALTAELALVREQLEQSGARDLERDRIERELRSMQGDSISRLG